jgi:hypothetical protein
MCPFLLFSLAEEESPRTLLRRKVIRGELRELRSEFTDTVDLTIHVATWNVNGRRPSEGLVLDELLDVQDPADIYVVGFQVRELLLELGSRVACLLVKMITAVLGEMQLAATSPPIRFEFWTLRVWGFLSKRYSNCLLVRRPSFQLLLAETLHLWKFFSSIMHAEDEDERISLQTDSSEKHAEQETWQTDSGYCYTTEGPCRQRRPCSSAGVAICFANATRVFLALDLGETGA